MKSLLTISIIFFALNLAAAPSDLKNNLLGQKLQRENILKKDKQGMGYTYYENGNVECKVSLNDNEKHGIYQCFSPKGKLIEEGRFVNGQTDGLVKAYYDNGKLKCNAVIKKNLRNGTQTCYYENGNKKHEVPFENDSINGTVKEYDERGTLTTTIDYQNNAVNGFYKQFKGEKVFMEAQYKNNVLEGFQRFYTSDGELIVEFMFKQDKMISGKCARGKIFTKEELVDIQRGSGKIDCR